MPVRSAGILLYRVRGDAAEVFLIHFGGPLWADKDHAAWSIPKGIIAPQEDPLEAARREFLEETGFAVDGQFEALGTFRQKSGKDLTVWALEGDCDPAHLRSNMFSMMRPPRSGQHKEFPEADRGSWFVREDANKKIVKGERKVLDCFFEKRI